MFINYLYGVLNFCLKNQIIIIFILLLTMNKRNGQQYTKVFKLEL